MTKLPLSATTRPAIALFAEDYATDAPFRQAVERQKAEEILMASASG